MANLSSLMQPRSSRGQSRGPSQCRSVAEVAGYAGGICRPCYVAFYIDYVSSVYFYFAFVNSSFCNGSGQFRRFFSLFMWFRSRKRTRTAVRALPSRIGGVSRWRGGARGEVLFIWILLVDVIRWRVCASACAGRVGAGAGNTARFCACAA